jgi:hypothetical protein
MDADLAVVQERFLAGLKGIVPTHSPNSDTVGGFAPLLLSQLFDEPEPLEPEWILEDILARGSLTALVAKPKVGKTTIAYELAVRVSQGRPYLGRATQRGSVLIIGVEEHRREIKRRLRNLAADQPDAIYVHAGPLTDSPDTLHALRDFIGRNGIALVIIDTLNAFWSVSEENDAGAVTQAIKPVLELARETNAAVLLIHHARKSEGNHGDDIRGSGALFSLLDVALILKRHDVETQRKLNIISRFPEAPPELILELRDHGHECLGDPAAVGKVAKQAKLVGVLTATPTDAKTLAAQAGLSVKATYTLLDGLVQQGKAIRSGSGRKGDPFLFSQFVSVSFPKTGGVEATHSSQLTPSAQPLPPGGEFVSSYPSTLGVDRKETNFGALPDSFLPTPIPPGSNESETDEEFIIDGGVHVT